MAFLGGNDYTAINQIAHRRKIVSPLTQLLPPPTAKSAPNVVGYNPLWWERFYRWFGR